MPASATIRITVGARPDLRRNDVAGLVLTPLDRARIACRTTTQVLDAATAARPPAVRLSNLQALDPLFTAIGEILLAQTSEEI